MKAQTASMIYVDTRSTKHEPYLLNLIDTPGHIDFSYEGHSSKLNKIENLPCNLLLTLHC